MTTQRKAGMCPCGTEGRRPGQGYGAKCHAQAERIYRARNREKRERMEQELASYKMRDMAERITSP